MEVRYSDGDSTIRRRKRSKLGGNIVLKNNKYKLGTEYYVLNSLKR